MLTIDKTEFRSGIDLQYGSWIEREKKDTSIQHLCNEMEIIVPELLSGSDYVNGTIGKSNYEVFLEMFGNYYGVRKLYGGCSTYGIMLSIPASKHPEIAEVLESLENYPLIDEDHHSNLEQEITDKCWTNYGLQDLRYALSDKEIDPDTFTDDELLKLWYRAVELTGNYEFIEDLSTYFPIDDNIDTIIQLIPVIEI